MIKKRRRKKFLVSFLVSLIQKTKKYFGSFISEGKEQCIEGITNNA
jgi:hypothetical protein